MENNKVDRGATDGSVQGQQVPLRQQAEERLRALENFQPEPNNLENFQHFVHELRLHQIELEIQNEELRLAQQEMEVSQNRFRDLYNFAPVGYLTVSEAGLILEANRTAAILLGVETVALVGQAFTHFVLPDDQDIYYHHRAAIFETEEPQTCKLRMLRVGDEPFWARMETAPGSVGWQEPLLCRIMLSDINDGVMLAAERTQVEVKYRQIQKTESLGLMAGAIAHHFNNRLGVVLGYLDIAMEGIPKGSPVVKYVESAITAARLAAEVSGSMLTYLGQSLGKHEPLDLVEVCSTSLARIREVIPQEVDMVIDLPTTGLIIDANAHQIQQVLKNMLTNAWEALRDGRNIIRLTVKTVAPGDIPDTNHFPLDWRAQKELYACLEVSDNGSGIDPADIEKVFDPFFTSKFLGRGLGLPIVLGIVRAHNGVVTVASEINRGTVISVYLPVCVGEVLPFHYYIKCRSITGGCTFLVVDDEPMLCEIAKAMLTRLGYTVLVAKNGFEAVDVFQQYRQSICCVLCDLAMPGMDGWETLTALRQLAPDLPVILSSGYDQVHAMAGEHDEYPQYFLAKPYNFAGLREAIEQVAAGSSDVQHGRRQG